MQVKFYDTSVNFMINDDFINLHIYLYVKVTDLHIYFLALFFNACSPLALSEIA